MFGGGGGMNPRKMQQMMEQMGIDVTEIDAEEVVITTTDGRELVFSDADVTQMDARGQETYQILGQPEEREATAAVESGDADAEADSDEPEIPDSDVEIVVQRTGASEEEARAALKGADGDLATAIATLE
ncbi:nascent polypeptide-associated complex subunit alpha [Halarchaeum rubridurum]|uniref:Nascent polypeptide-associated complex protein n=2 Tax=Halarchaeum rubridurum TaxID=489911 RepID=A0A8T4GNV6_9EURY|nr:nascent polypeptide-associated complex protein [Halarchaeum rubridurum]MBP1955296.1 nascent polypeptide-associated complex subunit alpha [Halarchaeum rubridurum]